MVQNILNHSKPSGLHVAIIMDGNGRWAARNGKPRFIGHRAGAEALRHVVEAAPDLGVTTLTAYAFSSDNWRRPPDEVKSLMHLFRRYLRSEIDRLVKNEVKLSFIGRRDRFSAAIVKAMEASEAATANGELLHLRLAVDYSARDAIIRAACRLNKKTVSRETFSRILSEKQSTDLSVPDVDLLIRTGGEQRLSDFLLWECAYAELYFTNAMWPEFNGDSLQTAVNEFYSRERRFGRIPNAAAG